jgi:hypothetical protein
MNYQLLHQIDYAPMSSPPTSTAKASPDTSVPDKVCNVLIAEIEEPDTLFKKNRHCNYKFVRDPPRSNRQSNNGYFALSKAVEAWESLPDVEKSKVKVPQATVRLLGEISETFLGAYGDSGSRATDEVCFEIDSSITNPLTLRS